MFWEAANARTSDSLPDWPTFSCDGRELWRPCKVADAVFFFFNDVSMEQLTNLWFGASLTTFLILDYLILLIFGLDSLGDITDRPGLGLPKPHSYIPLPATSIKELFSYIPVQRMPKWGGGDRNVALWCHSSDSHKGRRHLSPLTRCPPKLH